MAVRPIAEAEEEDQLRTLLRRGEHLEALSAAVALLGPDLARFCMALLGEQHAADNVVQQTFTAFYRALPKLDGHPLRRWLFGNALRLGRRELAARPAGPTGGARTRASQHQLSVSATPRQTRGALSALRRDEREAILLRYVARLDYAAIASLCTGSPDDMRRKVGRALVTVLQEDVTHGRAEPP